VRLLLRASSIAAPMYLGNLNEAADNLHTLVVVEGGQDFRGDPIRCLQQAIAGQHACVPIGG